MTLTLLDLYNSAASQEWAMYDNDAASQAELENSLIIAINKALTEILYSYPFKFRKRTHVFLTIPKQDSYDIPKGLIMKDENGNYRVRINTSNLQYIENLSLMILNDSSSANSSKTMKLSPNCFTISGEQIILYPVPAEKCVVTIDYLTLAIGENNNEDEIYALKNYDDTVYVPEHLEELLKNAVISRTLLNSIASESDENYSAYKKQSETAYRLLIKYSKCLSFDKAVKV